uniref:Beta-glucosidase n=1 Tax=Rhizophora mucronata TaxID=61149 RepID=A0A2P2L1X7_RHIMU
MSSVMHLFITKIVVINCQTSSSWQQHRQEAKHRSQTILRRDDKGNPSLPNNFLKY